MQIGELFVRIRGDASPLSRSLRGASGDLGAFDKSVGKLQRSMQTLRANWLAVSAVIGTVGFALNKTFQAADAFEASQRKLASTAKITGQNLGFLQTVAADANKEFGIGARMANDFAIEVTKLTGKAGQIEQTGEALGKLLDLGAGRGFNASQTLQAVQQAILGIDEGTDKLFGKNPSVIYAEFAAQVGISAAKMNDQQKAMALLNAAMQDGGKVAGAYAEFLKSAAGQTEQNRIRTEELAAAIGRSMESVRRAVLPIWAAMLEEVREFVEEARGIPVHLGVIAAKAKVLGAAIADAFGNSISGGQAGKSAENAARANLARVEAAARESFARIRNEMNLAAEIVGPTSPIVTGIQNITTATNTAATAAANLAANFRSAKIEADNLATSKGLVTLTKAAAGRTANVTGGGPSAPGIIQTARMPAAEAGGGGILGQVGNAFTSQLSTLALQFGPLAAAAATLRPVFEGLMETLGPVLSTLAEPLRTIGALLGTVITPVLRLLAPPLNLLAKGVSYVVEAFGWLIEALGRFVDKIVPDWISKAGKGLAKMGQELQDGARDARRNMGKFTDGVDDFGKAVDKASQSLVNYANVQHINALRFGIGAGMGSHTSASVPGRSEVTVNVNGVPAEVQVERNGKVVQRINSRGGTTRFQLAT